MPVAEAVGAECNAPGRSCRAGPSHYRTPAQMLALAESARSAPVPVSQVEGDEL
jgi:hypothetical protein